MRAGREPPARDPGADEDDPGTRTDELVAQASTWARERDTRVGGLNPWTLLIGTARACGRDRIIGLAAEMSFFALLSLVPIIVAIGAGLSLAERVIGADTVARAQEGIIAALDVVFSSEVTDEVVAPLVEGLFAGQRGGIAASSLLVALYLASRVFTATIRALDLAYAVPERRNFVVQRLVAIGLALGSVVLVVASLVLFVLGPLLGTGEELAARLGLSEAFATLWELARFPVLLVIGVCFFAAVYYFAPNVSQRFRDGVPGAVVALVGWLLASAGLRLYLSTVGSQPIGLAEADESVRLLGQGIGAVAAAVLWVFLSGIVLLVGGELNAEIAAARGRLPGRRRRAGTMAGRVRGVRGGRGPDTDRPRT